MFYALVTSSKREIVLFLILKIQRVHDLGFQDTVQISLKL